MGDKRNLRSIWESTDQSYIDALEEGKKSMDKRKNLDAEDSDSDSRSTSSAFSELYAAIPNEFRPKKAATSVPKTLGESNAKHRTGKQKDMTSEKYPNFTNHLQQKNPSNVNDGIGIRSSNSPSNPRNKHVGTCVNSSETKSVKYNFEIAQSDGTVKSQLVSKVSPNVPEEQNKFTNKTNCTKLQKVRVYKSNKQRDILINITSEKCKAEATCGISTLTIDCKSKQDSDPNSEFGPCSLEKIFYSKSNPDTYVVFPAEDEHKGKESNNVHQRDSVNFNNNMSKRNNLSKISQSHSISSEEENSLNYNICSEKQNAMPKKAEWEYQKQNVDKADSNVTSLNKKSPVLIIEHKCYISNCCCDQRIGGRNDSENTGPSLDLHRCSNYVKNKINVQNKQPFTKYRNVYYKNSSQNRNYRRNRSQWGKYSHGNSFQNYQSKLSKSGEYLKDSDSTYTTRKSEERANDSKNKNLSNYSSSRKDVKSQGISYSVRSSECPSTSSSSSSDDDADDDLQPIQYRCIVPTGSTESESKLNPKPAGDNFQNKSTKTGYGKKMVRWRGNYSRKYKSNIGTNQRKRETIEVLETRTYQDGRLLREVTCVNYEDIKSDAQEVYNTISSNRTKGKIPTATEKTSKENFKNVQYNDGKCIRQGVKWKSDLSPTGRRVRNVSPEKAFPDAIKKASSIEFTKINSSQFRHSNTTYTKAPSQNETKAACLPVSKVEEIDSFSFSYAATKSKRKTKGCVNTSHHTELNDLKNVKRPSGGCSGFPEKSSMKNDEPWDGYKIKEFESMINGRRKNIRKVYGEGECNDNNEFSVENKRNPTQRQTLINHIKMSGEQCSNFGTEHKEESASDVPDTCALKTEESKKQTDELPGLMRKCLVIDSELSTKRKMLMQYGQEISDFILGTHFAVQDLSSLYLEWSEKRENTMQLFITLARNLANLKNCPGKLSEIMKQIKLGGDMVSAVPLPYCSIIGRLISVVASITSALMSPSNPKPMDLDEISITLSLQQDLEVSSELYRQCLSCDQQIENTSEFIRQFYLTVANENCECLFETSYFLQKIMELKPGHNTFYKRLKKAIEETIQKNLNSELETSFCKLFVEYPSALNIVDKLDWRFRAEGFHFDSLENRWQELSIALLSYDSLTLDDILSKIQNYIQIFGSEELAVKRTLSRFRNF